MYKIGFVEVETTGSGAGDVVWSVALVSCRFIAKPQKGDAFKALVTRETFTLPMLAADLPTDALHKDRIIKAMQGDETSASEYARHMRDQFDCTAFTQNMRAFLADLHADRRWEIAHCLKELDEIWSWSATAARTRLQSVLGQSVEVNCCAGAFCHSNPHLPNTRLAAARRYDIDIDTQGAADALNAALFSLDIWREVHCSDKLPQRAHG